MTDDRDNLNAIAAQIAASAAAEQRQAQANQPIAIVQVTLTADGKVAANCKVPSRQVLLMMLMTAMLDLNDSLNEREKQKAAEGPQIETPNAGGILLAG